ncbi:DNA repair protein XRCC3 isoform X2 [Mus musculus]|uniref:DNA repair protein XRCC3 isoform X2 n=1 Tax=Mus musculus TaxID=10090 RepID=UPI0000F4A7D6|nr:DNA repair protein XRCC3 isoform X2 [Mus musculus]|eukprot:XP_006516363.1 PREDICTED: DNA repair protein XRCC3 isoform X1 [Mus musculus]
MDLDQLDLNPRITAAVKRGRLKSVKEILCYSGPDLQRLTGLPSHDVQCLLRAASLHLRGSRVLSGAVYICTEDAFPSKRLWQLIAQQRRLRTDAPEELIEKIRFSNHIFIEHAADVDTLLECVSKKVPILLSRGMARLVVVDSIAAPFRCEFHLQASAIRAKLLLSLGATLRRLSSTFRSPVLCINQVTDMVEDQQSVSRSLGASEERLSPALGITWANQLLMRLMVDRTHEDDVTTGLPRSPVRTLRVLFAPHLPLSSCCYTVSGEGIRGMPGTQSY